MSRNTRGHPVARSILMSLAAMVVYGGWAVIANYAHGWSAAARAGVTQAALSFTSTASKGSQEVSPTP